MHILTKKQLQVLNIIRSYINKHNISPTLQEIQTELKLASVATVHKHLQSLQKKGFLEILPKHRRGLIPIERSMSHSLQVPIIGSISLGKKIETFPKIESLFFPSGLVGEKRALYALVVRDDSFTEQHILEKDLILIEAGKTISSKQAILVEFKDEGITICRFLGEYHNDYHLAPLYGPEKISSMFPSFPSHPLELECNEALYRQNDLFSEQGLSHFGKTPPTFQHKSFLSIPKTEVIIHGVICHLYRRP